MVRIFRMGTTSKTFWKKNFILGETLFFYLVSHLQPYTYHQTLIHPTEEHSVPIKRLQ